MLRERVEGICEWKNLTLVGGYGMDPVKPDDVMAWLDEYGTFALQYVCDTGDYLDAAAAKGRKHNV